MGETKHVQTVTLILAQFMVSTISVFEFRKSISNQNYKDTTIHNDQNKSGQQQLFGWKKQRLSTPKS